MVKSISRYLAGKLSNNKDQCDILTYGLECIINTFIPVLIYIVYSAFHAMMLPMLCWLGSFLVYRNIIGGYHAKSHFRCILASIILGIISLSAIQFFTNISLLIKIIVIVLLIILRTQSNPIIHRNEHANDTVYLKKQKKKSIFMLIFFLGIIVLFHLINPSVSSAVFIGIISAEILYMIYKLLPHQNN